ncbi:DUF4180 domain-containing protein [Streptomyces sp. SID13031]|uniref:DUF4180 domain-containing protein n=1 Tax=Streptomyces sp. SID13031 TaxID=2706046 RepID=UPI0013CCFD6D|nr:DUF4180 domain-containing protein [Streptomyces sp. SID13031]NEA36831.1 DUF4180 domain-containing protein [Streptomyces sp. SID13031]
MQTYRATTTILNDRDAVDVIAEAHYTHQAEWVVVPVELLPAEFFRLGSGVAGGIVQKFVTYQMGLVVLGDVSAHEAASTSFRDWVREANRGRHLRFVPDEHALDCWHGGDLAAGA